MIPAVVTRYLAAADARDAATLADCFAPDGTVVDEGHTYTGRAEIIGWRDALARQWIFTTTVTATESVSPTEYRVRARVEGNFPGGVADLTYRFAVDAGAITALTIAG